MLLTVQFSLIVAAGVGAGRLVNSVRRSPAVNGWRVGLVLLAVFVVPAVGLVALLAENAGVAVTRIAAAALLPGGVALVMKRRADRTAFGR